MPLNEGEFESLLEQVRELHRVADELPHSRARLHANVRARLTWTDPPDLPPEQMKVADDAVEALQQPRLSSSQARRLEREFFGR